MLRWPDILRKTLGFYSPYCYDQQKFEEGMDDLHRIRHLHKIIPFGLLFDVELCGLEEFVPQMTLHPGWLNTFVNHNLTSRMA